MKKFIACFFGAILAMSATHSHASQLNTNFNTDSVKYIECVNGIKKDTIYMNSGSGVVINYNMVLTAMHVVYGAQCTIDHQPVKVIAASKTLDVAVLSVKLPPGTPVAKFSCEGYQFGSSYTSYGFSSKNPIYEPVVRTRDVTFTNPNDHFPFIVQNLSGLHGLVLQGMSGGPIIDQNGVVIGINNGSDSHSVVGSRPLSETPLCIQE